MNFTMLQATRFVAAFLVVLYHCGKMFEQPKYYFYRPFGGLLDGGGLGVDYFFVLSGFVILTAHFNHIGHPQRLPGYLISRATRIYPLYWIVAISVLLPLYFVNTSFDSMIASPTWLLKEFLLLPADHDLVLVTWTLRFEIIFYVLFATLLCNRDFGVWVLGAWFIASATVTGFAEHGLANHFGPQNLQFLLGLAAALLLRGYKITAPRAMLLLGAGGFAACFIYGGLIHGDLSVPGSPNLTVTVGLCAAIIIGALVELERGHGWYAPPLLRYLGDASYAIYLVHMPLNTPFVWLARYLRLERVLPLPVLVTMMAAVGVIGGVLVYHFVDRPVRQVLRRVLRIGDPAPLFLATESPALSESRR